MFSITAMKRKSTAIPRRKQTRKTQSQLATTDQSIASVGKDLPKLEDPTLSRDSPFGFLFLNRH
jgi:hypothetical protein